MSICAVRSLEVSLAEHHNNTTLNHKPDCPWFLAQD